MCFPGQGSGFVTRIAVMMQNPISVECNKSCERKPAGIVALRMRGTRLQEFPQSSQSSDVGHMNTNNIKAFKHNGNYTYHMD
jgi:hypothetical protein